MVENSFLVIAEILGNIFFAGAIKVIDQFSLGLLLLGIWLAALTKVHYYMHGLYFDAPGKIGADVVE